MADESNSCPAHIQVFVRFVRVTLFTVLGKKMKGDRRTEDHARSRSVLARHVRFRERCATEKRQYVRK